MTAQFDEYFMKMALREAEKAASEDEVPLGAVVVAPAVLEPAHDGHPAVFDPNPAVARILGRAHNMSEGMKDATAHAEMLAMSAAFQAVGDWRLTGARLYVTKEPCPMCAGAIVLARLDAVVWGVGDPKRGATIPSEASGIALPSSSRSRPLLQVWAVSVASKVT